MAEAEPGSTAAWPSASPWSRGWRRVGLAMVAGLVPDLFALLAGRRRSSAPRWRARHRPRRPLAPRPRVRRIDGSFRREPGGGRIADADLGTMVRGVRLVFLAAASFTAAAGWLLAEPLPLVIALVIAGVDVVETSFLLPGRDPPLRLMPEIDELAVAVGRRDLGPSRSWTTRSKARSARSQVVA